VAGVGPAQQLALRGDVTVASGLTNRIQRRRRHMFRPLLKYLLAITLTFVIYIPGTAHAVEKWDMSTVLPAGNFQVKNAVRFAEEVKKATNGEVVITVHPGGALGLKGPESLIAVRDGVVPIADIQMNQQVGENTFWGIESLPYLAGGYKQLQILQKYTRPVFDKLAKDYGQKILYIVPWPPQNVFASVAADQSVSQLKGIKLRTIDKNATEFFKRIGAAPIQMPWGEVVPALATGALNAVSTSSSSGVDGKFWEFMGYMNQWEWQMNSQMVNVNLEAWNRLKPETQKAIEDIAKKLEPQFWDVSRAEDERNIKTLMKNGMKIAVPTDEVKADIAKIGSGMWDEYASSAGEPAKSVIASYRKEAGK
jgi:TRAP-type C4-dicarboxylate transport system substrate-binding protein